MEIPGAKERASVFNARQSGTNESLFFVSDVWRRVIENGGVEPPKSNQKGPVLPFAATVEQLQRFEYSEEPLLVSHIAKRVNDLVETENTKKLTGAAILNWLESVGLVEEVLTETGRKSHRPTAQGNSIGITVHLRNGPAGDYQAVVYDRQAQQFIVDNMESIAELARRRG